MPTISVFMPLSLLEDLNEIEWSGTRFTDRCELIRDLLRKWLDKQKGDERIE